MNRYGEPLEVFEEDQVNHISKTIAIKVSCPDEIVKAHNDGNLEMTYICPYEIANFDNSKYEAFLSKYTFGFVSNEEDFFYVFAIDDFDEIDRIIDMIR